MTIDCANYQYHSHAAALSQGMGMTGIVLSLLNYNNNNIYQLKTDGYLYVA